MPLFTPKDRTVLRATLLDRASADERISGAAITGSAAESREDRWSDIDLAFGIQDASLLPAILAEWTAYMYGEHQALHHYDLLAGSWTCRVFLLANTLQVDLAFVAAGAFRALAPSFRRVFGKAEQPLLQSPPAAGTYIGLGWLYGLHARTCIARGQVWQAEYMISAMRDTSLGMACTRYGLTAAHGRGFDCLPDEVKATFAAAVVRHLDDTELSRAFRAAMDAYLNEVRRADESLALRLEATLTLLMMENPEQGKIGA